MCARARVCVCVCVCARARVCGLCVHVVTVWYGCGMQDSITITSTPVYRVGAASADVSVVYSTDAPETNVSAFHAIVT
jgi:hypothetical protein